MSEGTLFNVATQMLHNCYISEAVLVTAGKVIYFSLEIVSPHRVRKYFL